MCKNCFAAWCHCCTVNGNDDIWWWWRWHVITHLVWMMTTTNDTTDKYISFAQVMVGIMLLTAWEHCFRYWKWLDHNKCSWWWFARSVKIVKILMTPAPSAENAVNAWWFDQVWFSFWYYWFGYKLWFLGYNALYTNIKWLDLDAETLTKDFEIKTILQGWYYYNIEHNIWKSDTTWTEQHC